MFCSGKLVPEEEEATLYIKCSGFWGREETNTCCFVLFFGVVFIVVVVWMELCGPDQKNPHKHSLGGGTMSAEKRITLGKMYVRTKGGSRGRTNTQKSC